MCIVFQWTFQCICAEHHRSASECSHFQTRTSFWPRLAVTKKLWQYLSLRVTNTPTHTQRVSTSNPPHYTVVVWVVKTCCTPELCKSSISIHVLLVNIVTVTRFLTNISIELNVVSDVL